MSHKRFAAVRTTLSVIAISFWAAGATTRVCAEYPVRSPRSPTAQEAKETADDSEEPSTAIYDDAHARRPLHGGLLTVIEPLAFEVVYRPRQVRVYVYGPEHQPVTAQGIRGEVVLRLPKADKVARVPMRYAGPSPGSQGQDYLAADLKPGYLQDDDLTPTVNLRNLPLPYHPKPAPSQITAPSKAKPQIALATTKESDLDRIAQQKVCPVMGSDLHSMGTPIKILVNGEPLYLCCWSCLPKLENTPETYLAKIQRPGHEK